MKRQITFALLSLTLVLSLGAAAANAGGDNFRMDRDMKELLPPTADIVLAVSSLDELDELWRELLPDNPDRETSSLSGILKETKPELVEHVDWDKPLLVVLDLQPPMGGAPFFVTGLLALKDKNFDVASVPDLEQFTTLRSGRYLAVSNDPAWTPATEEPLWVRELGDGLVSASLDFVSLFKTYGFLIEMGLAQMEASGDEADLEMARATIKMIRSLINSAEGLDLIFDQDGKTVTKDFVFRTIAGSELAPGPQPSFDDALKLTRFLPGGENLLFVSALDQTNQVNAFMDYYLASNRAAMESMDSATAEKYLSWYTDYLNAMTISFSPSAMTLRFEEGEPHLQSIIKSDNPTADWNRLVDLADRMNNLGVGIDLIPLEIASFKGHEVRGWSLAPKEDELDVLLNSGASQPLDGMTLTSNMIPLLRLLPDNLYLAQVEDHLLVCCGPNSGSMEELIRRVEKGKGKVDPRLKKVNKRRDGRVQTASVGDLNALLFVVMEVLEEMEEGQDLPSLTNEPLPFLHTLEIDGTQYQAHVEMEKSTIRSLIKAILEWDQD